MLENKEGLPWSAYVGAAGMPGTSMDIRRAPTIGFELLVCRPDRVLRLERVRRT